MKKNLLNAYDLVLETKRQTFRQSKKRGDHGYVEFVWEKETLFDRWCLLNDIVQIFYKLRSIFGCTIQAVYLC